MKPPPDVATGKEDLALCTEQIVRSEGVPPFALHVKELLTRSLDPDTGTAHLTRVILKDLGLTSQLLRTANSPLYNRSGKAITNIGHAVTLLGWDTVRNLVGAMRYVEHYARYSPGLRELMMFSLLSATHGRQVASLVSYPRPEEAFVAGLLRNLGEVALARYYGRSYADMLLIMKREQLSERLAAIRIFHFDMDQLTNTLAEAWHLPEVVSLSLASVPIHGTMEQKSLASVTAYGHELTRALYRRAQDVEVFQSKTILSPLGKQCLISKRELRRMVDSAVEDTSLTFQSLGIPVASLRLEEQAECAREVLAMEAESQVECSAEAERVLAEAERQVQTDDFEIGELIARALEALADGGHPRRAIFALMSEDRGFIRGRLAAGPSAEADLKAFRFSAIRGDGALSAVIDRQQDLWIDRKTDHRFEQSCLVAALNPARFAVMPVVVDGVVAGALYADDNEQSIERFSVRIERVRGLIREAIARKRFS